MACGYCGGFRGKDDIWLLITNFVLQLILTVV